MLTSNNAVELSGATLGSRDVIPGLFRRPVTITVRQPSTRLELGPAFLLRRSESSPYVSLIASVTNPADDYLYWLRATNMRWLTMDGSVLSEKDGSYLQGGVGDAGGIYTDTCLGRGDVGYLFDIERSPAGGSLFQAGSIELSVESSASGSPAPASLLATQYLPCKDARQFEVAFESRGSAAVGLWKDSVATYFLLDDQGPIEWGSLYTRRGLGIYDKGKVTVGGAANFYAGPVTRLHVYSSFDDPMGL
jgi:hypothetical protein